MGSVIALSFTAALNPTLVAASTLMMILPNPRRLMLGYLLWRTDDEPRSSGPIILRRSTSRAPSSSTQNTINPAVESASA